MDTDRVKFPAPRSDAARTLNELVERRAGLYGELRDAEARAAIAPKAQLAASAELSALIARRAGGEAGLDGKIKAAERKVAAFRQEAGEPWPERLGGLRSALRSADADVAKHVAEHYDELAGELEADAEAVKRRADRALEEVIAAYLEREHHVERVHALISATGIRVRPGTVPWSKLEPVAKLAEEVLAGDGERAPVPRYDPRQPQHGAPIPEEAPA